MYTVTDVMQVSKKRLDLFFTRVDGHFRINKRIRDYCVFAPHNILKDPPFSRVDLISCCNLLIYFDTVLQRKVMANFHYALNKKGYLILGKSETIGSSTNLFTQVDKKVKIYMKKPEAPSSAIFDVNYHPEEVSERVLPKLHVKPSLKELTATESLSIESVIDGILLSQYVPAGVVVRRRWRIPRGEPDTRLGRGVNAAAGPAAGPHKRARLRLARAVRAVCRRAVFGDVGVDLHDRPLQRRRNAATAHRRCHFGCLPRACAVRGRSADRQQLPGHRARVARGALAARAPLAASTRPPP